MRCEAPQHQKFRDAIMFPGPDTGAPVFFTNRAQLLPYFREPRYGIAKRADRAPANRRNHVPLIRYRVLDSRIVNFSLKQRPIESRSKSLFVGLLPERSDR